MPSRPGPKGPRWARRGCGFPGRTGPARSPRSSDERADFVAGGLSDAHDTRCHRRHQWVVELAEQRAEPPVGSARSRSPRTRRVGLWTAASPDVAQRPPGRCSLANPTKRAPWRSATSLVAPASADASSTTTQGRPAEAFEHPVELCRPVAHRHYDRHVARTREPCRPLPEGRRRPADANRRARQLGPPAASDRPRRPASASTSCRARSEIRKRRSGLPPSKTVPPSNSCVDPSSFSVKGAGQWRRGPGGRGPQRGGHPGCAGLGHRSNLGSPGPAIGWAGAQGGRDAG